MVLLPTQFLLTGFLPRYSFPTMDSYHGILPHNGFLPRGIPSTHDSSLMVFFPYRIPPTAFLPHGIPSKWDTSYGILPKPDTFHVIPSEQDTSPGIPPKPDTSHVIPSKEDTSHGIPPEWDIFIFCFAVRLHFLFMLIYDES